MSVRCWRSPHHLLFLLSALCVIGCYRAQIDVQADGAAGSAASGSGGDAECADASVDVAQFECRTLLPTKSECASQDSEGWNGCVDGGCNVCADVTTKYPYYFAWHPCCEPNLYCAASQRVKCNARCPAPTANDRVRPCWLGRLSATQPSRTRPDHSG